ncbi:PorP/SprF family type IX secretion system membrane protein [Spirosoma fluviale]|uniref:Type IX secretion system membrane protein, PorP/SprF family n=1 Tax=Spirosoma fluviale TaxID=1597977 RepID=A0A286GSJ1_9BACT|nr:type IX secretion system membrane protein PorP/SprF [Spirosoma fluviale]SOD97924.1 type IX secretion system membrane protein, PorP/SprF family [Spirosoma fluviale]
MIRTLYVFAFLLLTIATQNVFAQGDPQLSLYMYNPLYYNPAAAGSEGVSRFQITHRTQYLGYQTIGTGDESAAQSTQVLSFNMPLAKIKSGIGIYAMNDKYGPSINQSVQVSYAYRLTLKNGTLAVGVQAGMFNRGFDFNQFRPVEPGDPLLNSGRINQFKPDLGAGIYYNTTDYWLGVSMTHLNRATYSYIADRSTDPANSKAYLTAGYRLGIGYNIDVQPSVLVQYSTAEGVRGSLATLNLVATYDNRIWAGVGYRLKDAVMATAGINLMRNNALRLGYALDVTAGGTQIKSPTSHEILLSYALPAPDVRKKPIIRTPRFRY